jgi:pimeloyl-ACP methyl ester carboxylesterase
MVVLVSSLGIACSRGSPSPSDARPGDAVSAAPDSTALDAAAPDASTTRAPLAGYPWQIELGDPPKTKLGFLSVPLGAREPRPLVIALHGGADRPDWACNEWRAITSGYPFIVCPRGPGGSEASLAWSSPADTKTRIERAVAATRAMFETWLEDAPIVLVGFSMGATQTALLAKGDPKTYPRVVLSESAYAPEAAMAFAEPWAKGGGERAIFSCTTVGCEATYRRAARNVAAQRVPVRLNIAGTNEHGMWDEVLRSMRRDWPWLVEGAIGWEAYVPPREDAPLPGKTETFAGP